MSLRTPLGRVRGLGSAKDGTAHWWAQRVTAVALIPLTVWFVASIAANAGMDYAAASEWISSPVVAILLILTIMAVCHHAQLGLQVVIEDYIHNELAKVALILLEKFAAVAIGIACIFSVLKISLGA